MAISGSRIERRAASFPPEGRIEQRAVGVSHRGLYAIELLRLTEEKRRRLLSRLRSFHRADVLQADMEYTTIASGDGAGLTASAALGLSSSHPPKFA